MRTAITCPTWHTLESEDRKEYLLALALRNCPGLGPVNLGRLLSHFDTATLAVANIGQWRSIGISNKAITAFRNEEWKAKADAELKATEKDNPYILLRTNPAYPAQLRELVDAPALLYCLGDLNLLNNPSVAIVGSRKPDAKGKAAAGHFARTLAFCGITVISGMALGIDTEAHTNAVKQVGSSIAILGSGLKYDYPKQNKKLREEMSAKGLMISEFAANTAPLASNFPIRNRIISGLSLGIIVIAAGIKSGSLITAQCALKQNREVYAIPGDMFDESSMGCQELIRNGARAIFNVNDILVDLAPRLKAYQLDSEQLKELCENADQHLSTNSEIELRSQQSSQQNKTLTERKTKTNSLQSTDNKITQNRQVASEINTSSDQILNASQIANQATNQIEAQEAKMQNLEDFCADLNETEVKIILAIHKVNSIHVDTLAEELDMESYELNIFLTDLEMAGKIRKLVGGFYRLTI